MKNHGNYKHGKTLVEQHCLRCGIKLSKLAYYNKTVYCRSCSSKERLKNPENNPNWKGKSLIKYYCIDCNKEVSTENTKRCLSCAGKERLKDPKDNPCYIDGRTELTQLIRNLDEYKNWRNNVYKRYNYTCKQCGSTLNIEAHHIKQFSFILQEFLNLYSQFSPIEDKETLVRLAISYEPFWNLDNGETYCRKCHSKIDSIRNILKKGNNGTPQEE